MCFVLFCRVPIRSPGDRISEWNGPGQPFSGQDSRLLKVVPVHSIRKSDLRVLGLAPRHDTPNRARCKGPLHKMTELPAESDASLFATLSTPAGKAAYVVSRFALERLPTVTIAVERVLKSSLDPTPTSTFQRARVLMTSMSMVICLWRVLNKGEQRRDIILKAHKSLTGGRYQSCEAPVACVDSALKTAIGSVLMWSQPDVHAKRARTT